MSNAVENEKLRNSTNTVKEQSKFLYYRAQKLKSGEQYIVENIWRRRLSQSAILVKNYF